MTGAEALLRSDRASAVMNLRSHQCAYLAAAGLLVALPAAASAQWTQRYQKPQGVAHNYFIESNSLPIMNAAATDPAESPDGKVIAVAARGWIWLIDKSSQEARRITTGGGVDSRPAWSPDGRSLAFVRDDSKSVGVVVRDLASGRERVIENGFAMDPAYSPDGSALYYASQVSGSVEIWRVDLKSGVKTQTTRIGELATAPQAHPDGKRIIFVVKTVNTKRRHASVPDSLRVLNLMTGEEKVLVSGTAFEEMRGAISPDGSVVAFVAPGENGGELRLVSVDLPGPTVKLVGENGGAPLTPAWSSDGREIYFVEGQSAGLTMRRIGKFGGEPAEYQVRHWDWAAPMGRLLLRTRSAGIPSPARLTITDGRGHPIIADQGQPYSDIQHGAVYFYGGEVTELAVPAGQYKVEAVRGIATPPVSAVVAVGGGQVKEVSLDMKSVWNAQANGWYSSDNHFHITSGSFSFKPEQIAPILQAEDIDVATPMTTNAFARFPGAELFKFERRGNSPIIRYGQEVRTALGHFGLMGASGLFWPWYFGPGTQVYRRDELSNATAAAFARRNGGAGTYVHPVLPYGSFEGDPFASDTGLNAIPFGLVADAVLGNVDAIEVADIFSDEVASAAVWKRLLTLGQPIGLNAGTDASLASFRTIAVGTSRVYVRVGGPLSYDSYVTALKAGRSFVTTGPLVDFRAGGVGPGGVVQRGSGKVAFTLELHSAVPAQEVRILVNGQPVWRGSGLSAAGSRTLSGTVNLPSGGWISAEVQGSGTMPPPGMDSYAYAITGPVWIDRVGSSEPAARRAAASDLIRALTNARARAEAAYGDEEPTVLKQDFERALVVLERASQDHQTFMPAASSILMTLPQGRAGARGK